MKAALRIALFFASAGLLPLACGETSRGLGSVADAGDAGDAVDAAPDVAADVVDAAYTVPRCPGAAYSAAPSGAACDAKRIVRQRGLEGSCYGPALGSFCHDFQTSVPVGDEAKLPSGFVCGSAELGVATCVWSFGDDAAPAHALDAAALEGACAATVALPTATVVCVNYGD